MLWESLCDSGCWSILESFIPVKLQVSFVLGNSINNVWNGFSRLLWQICLLFNTSPFFFLPVRVVGLLCLFFISGVNSTWLDEKFEAITQSSPLLFQFNQLSGHHLRDTTTMVLLLKTCCAQCALIPKSVYLSANVWWQLFWKHIACSHRFAHWFELVLMFIPPPGWKWQPTGVQPAVLHHQNPREHYCRWVTLYIWAYGLVAGMHFLVHNQYCT